MINSSQRNDIQLARILRDCSALQAKLDAIQERLEKMASQRRAAVEEGLG